MGLDMYLYKVRKLTEKENDTLAGHDVNTLYKNGCMVFEELNEGIEDLSPHLTDLYVKSRYIDIEQILRDNQVPEARVIAENYCCEKLTLTIKYNGNYNEITVNQNDYIRYQFKEVYVCKIEEVYYWRRAYDVQDEFYSHYNNEFRCIENCGYHKVKPETLDAIKELDKEFAENYTGGYEDIFYHEWY